MQDTLTILETVNQFYSQSFDQLLELVYAILGFTGIILGIIVPALAIFLQQRFFNLKTEKIKEFLRDELKKEIDTATTKIKNEYEKKESEYEKKISELGEKMKKQEARALSGIFHVQGNIRLKSGRFIDAFDDFINAASDYIVCDNEGNLKRVINLIINKCLPNLNKQILESSEESIENYKEFISNLSEYNTNNRYGDEIMKLKAEFKKAMNRTPKEETAH